MVQVVQTRTDKPLLEVNIEHNGYKLTFNTSMYDTASKTEFGDVFNFLNAYWATLPMSRQDAIFMAYRKAHDLFDDAFVNKSLAGKLIDIVRDIYDNMSFDELRKWVLLRSGIRFPTGLKDKYDEEYAKEDSQKRTYLRAEYIDLVVLALALRPMVPIWSEFITRNADLSGNTLKEYYALRILSKSWIMECEAMERLRVYLYFTTKDQITASVIIDSLSEDDLTYWLLGLALIRRISCVALSVKEGEDSGSAQVIANIWCFIINSTLKSLDRRFDGYVIDKNKSAELALDGDASTSLIELHKIKQPFSDGDLRHLSVYTEKVVNVAQTIDPTVGEQLVYDCLENINQMENFELEPHHEFFCKWIVSSALSPKSIDNLDAIAQRRIIAVIQALLWHWNYIDLAILATATPLIESEEMTLSGEYRAKLSNASVDEMIKIWPHHFRPGKTNAADDPVKIAKKHNVAITAIEIAMSYLTTCNWKINLPRPLHEQVRDKNVHQIFTIPSDIREQLASLLIKLATRRQWVQSE